MPEQTATAPETAGRLAWVDTAKALSIVLVVLHHTIGKHFELVVPDAFSGVATAWIDFTYWLRPVRMPLFFVASGLFAGAALTRPWRDVVHKRVLNIYYLYALWLAIHMALFLVLDDLPMNRTRDWPELVTNLLYASTGLWYLYALVAYFLVARLLSRVDPRVVVALAATLALITPALGIEAANRASLLQHFVYFAFAVHYPSIVGGMARLRWRSVRLVAGAAAVVAVVPVVLDAGSQPSRFVLSLLAVPLAVRMAAWLAEWPLGASLGSVVGRRTLPIYVLHVPVLGLLHALLVDAVPFEGTPGIASAAAIALYPLVVTCLVILACLGLHHAANRAGFAWLFSSPFGPARSSTTAAVDTTCAPAPVPVPVSAYVVRTSSAS